MPIRFPYVVLMSGALLSALVYISYKMGLVSAENEVYARHILLGIFVTTTLFLLFLSRKKLELFSSETNKGYTLLIISLCFLPVSTLFHIKIGTYGTGILIFISLIYLILNKTFHKLNPTYYFLFLYAALLIVGTIGTTKGFRFPDTALSYLLLPLAYSCFQLPKQTLMKIAHFFFRTMIIYMMICVVYWLYNFLYLDTELFKWLTNKSGFEVHGLQGWDEQLRIQNNYPFFSAYYFVNSWAYYFHPSFVALVLFFGLITGLYLYYKKSELLTVSKVELTLYIALSCFTIGLMESRIGLVGMAFILGITTLYYAKLKTNHFIAITSAAFILSCAVVFVFNDKVDSFINDKVRETYNTLSVNYIKDHFWWGTGFREQHLALEYQEQLMKDTLPIIETEKTYVHNQFLGEMVQYGVWGLLALVTMLSAFTRYAIKRKSYLLQVFLMTTILFMMIEEPLYVQKGITTFTIFLTFFMAISESERPRKSVSWGKRKEQLTEVETV